MLRTEEDKIVWMRGGSMAPARARHCVEQLMLGDAAPRRLEELRLLVSELVTNSVRHGGADPTRRIAVTLRGREDAVRVEVSDYGPGFAPSEVKQRDPMTPGGLGLVLVEKLARRWGVVRDTATRVWFELPLA